MNTHINRQTNADIADIFPARRNACGRLCVYGYMKPLCRLCALSEAGSEKVSDQHDATVNIMTFFVPQRTGRIAETPSPGF